MTVIKSLLYDMINVNNLIDFWERLFVRFRESLILINCVVYSVIFLLKLLIIIVTVFVVFKLIILICSLVIIHLSLLRVVRSVYTFISLIVQLVSLVLIRLMIWVWVWVCIFWCRLQRLMLNVILSMNLQWKHNCTDRSLLISIR